MQTQDYTTGGEPNTMNVAAMLAQIEALKAKLAAATKPRKLTLKVSEKGAVSVYGFGKWPVTLYASQWERLLQHSNEVTAFIEANRSVLAVKE